MLVSQLTERSEGRHPTAADQSSSTHRVGGVTLPGTGGVEATMSSLQEDLQDAYPDDSMEVDHPSLALRDADNPEEMAEAFDETSGAMS